MSLISDSGMGIQHRLDMVNMFMSHNDIKINCNKSSYHWARDDKAEVSVTVNTWMNKEKKVFSPIWDGQPT